MITDAPAAVGGYLRLHMTRADNGGLRTMGFCKHEKPLNEQVPGPGVAAAAGSRCSDGGARLRQECNSRQTGGRKGGQGALGERGRFASHTLTLTLG